MSVPYTITAVLGGKSRTATRCSAASAQCVADDWAEEGCSDIRIADRDGTVHAPDRFRANLPLRKRIEQRRSGLHLS